MAPRKASHLPCPSPSVYRERKRWHLEALPRATWRRRNRLVLMVSWYRVGLHRYQWPKRWRGAKCYNETRRNETYQETFSKGLKWKSVVTFPWSRNGIAKQTYISLCYLSSYYSNGRVIWTNLLMIIHVLKGIYFSTLSDHTSVEVTRGLYFTTSGRVTYTNSTNLVSFVHKVSRFRWKNRRFLLDKKPILLAGQGSNPGPPDG